MGFISGWGTKKNKKSDFDLRNNKETKCESVLPNQNSRPSSLLRNWKLHTSWIRRKFQERNFFSSLTSRTSTPSLYLKLDDDLKLWIVGGCWIMRAPDSVWSEEKNTMGNLFLYVKIYLIEKRYENQLEIWALSFGQNKVDHLLF